jgi:hypothetical protein
VAYWPWCLTLKRFDKTVDYFLVYIFHARYVHCVVVYRSLFFNTRFRLGTQKVRNARPPTSQMTPSYPPPYVLLITLVVALSSCTPGTLTDSSVNGMHYISSLITCHIRIMCSCELRPQLSDDIVHELQQRIMSANRKCIESPPGVQIVHSNVVASRQS